MSVHWYLVVGAVFVLIAMWSVWDFVRTRRRLHLLVTCVQLAVAAALFSRYAYLILHGRSIL